MQGEKESLDVGFLLDFYFYTPLMPFKCKHACDIALQGQEEIELCTAKHRRGKNWMEDRLQKRAWRRVKKDGGRGRHGSTAVSLSAPSSVVSVRHSLISSYDDDDDKVIKADVGWNKVSLSLHFQDRAAARSLVLKCIALV